MPFYYETANITLQAISISFLDQEMPNFCWDHVPPSVKEKFKHVPLLWWK